MMACEQTKGQSVLDHGDSVNDHMKDLVSHLANGTDLQFAWRVPAWLADDKEFILSNLHEEEIRIGYAVLHDCGKPFCREVDAEGKVHFPDHAAVSERTFMETYRGLDPDCKTIANLIGWDMLLHTESSEGVERHCRDIWSIQDAFTLLLTSLAEVHSNAELFGGIETVSFKSKWKQIDRRGKQILKFYKGEKS